MVFNSGRGSGGESVIPSQQRKSTAISGFGPWKPKARLATILRRLFMPSTTPLVRPIGDVGEDSAAHARPDPDAWFPIDSPILKAL